MEDSRDMVKEYKLSDIDLMLKCAKRELNKREYFYPKWIQKGKMTQEQADFEIEGMKRIVEHFQLLRIYGMPEQMKLL